MDQIMMLVMQQFYLLGAPPRQGGRRPPQSLPAARLLGEGQQAACPTAALGSH